MMKDFVMACQDNDDIANLKKEVETFSTSFPMPGTIYLFLNLLNILKQHY